MAKRRKTINLARFKLDEDDPKTVTLETLNGEDEIAASDRAYIAGGPNGIVTPSRIEEQYVAQAIVEVNGTAVPPPYVDWSKWSGRCRDFVRAAFHRLGSAQPKDMADFLKAEFAEDELGGQR